MFMKKIVISAVNITSGGTMSILKDCLTHASNKLSDNYKIIALVNNKNNLDFKNINFIEYPLSKKNWINRLFYEYIYFYFISKKIKPYLWLSLHDMTPNVDAEKRAVYCHNASPFYQANKLERKFNKKFWLFTKFYEYIYKINIEKNDYIIVQQDWLRSEFKKRFEIDSIIVANPNIKIPNDIESKNKIKSNECFKFFYPSFPRVFKNFELICEAAKILREKGIENIKFHLTIDGTENKYSKYIYQKYKGNNLLDFMGLISREEVFEMYNKVDALIFPSKLETWGMPITEFKRFNKPIFLSDLKYGHETIGDYSKVKFFNHNEPEMLADRIIDFISNNIKFDSHISQIINDPYVKSWENLFNVLLKE